MPFLYSLDTRRLWVFTAGARPEPDKSTGKKNGCGARPREVGPPAPQPQAARPGSAEIRAGSLQLCRRDDGVRGTFRTCRPFRMMAGDQPGTPLEGQIIPDPGECDEQAVAGPDQEVDLGGAPQHPSDPTAEPHPAEIGDRRLSSDGRQVAEVPVAERLGGLPTLQAIA